MEGLLTTQEAAELIGRSRRTLEAWRNDPKFKDRLKFVSDGYRVWYSPESVQAYLAGIKRPLGGNTSPVANLEKTIA